jgi:ABC-type branched-subunit amino acid transport system ATPase component
MIADGAPEAVVKTPAVVEAYLGEELALVGG